MDFRHHVKIGECNATVFPCDAVRLILEAETFSYEEGAGLVS